MRRRYWLKLFQKHNITGTFYFVGASAREVPESVMAVKAAGYEIGAHSLYHETVGEAIFPIPGMVPLLPHEIGPRLELNTRWIEEVCGVRPRSFRCPVSSARQTFVEVWRNSDISAMPLTLFITLGIGLSLTIRIAMTGLGEEISGW